MSICVILVAVKKLAYQEKNSLKILTKLSLRDLVNIDQSTQGCTHNLYDHSSLLFSFQPVCLSVVHGDH